MEVEIGGGIVERQLVLHDGLAKDPGDSVAHIQGRLGLTKTSTPSMDDCRLVLLGKPCWSSKVASRNDIKNVAPIVVVIFGGVARLGPLLALSAATQRHLVRRAMCQ